MYEGKSHTLFAKYAVPQMVVCFQTFLIGGWLYHKEFLFHTITLLCQIPICRSV